MNIVAAQSIRSRYRNGKRGIPVELFTSYSPLLGSTENFFEGMRRFFAADGEKDACGDDGGLRVSVDVDALALVSLAFLSFKSIFRICIFNDLIVDNCLPIVDFFGMILRKRDDRDG